MTIAGTALQGSSALPLKQDQLGLLEHTDVDANVADMTALINVNPSWNPQTQNDTIIFDLHKQQIYSDDGVLVSGMLDRWILA